MNALKSLILSGQRIGENIKKAHFSWNWMQCSNLNRLIFHCKVCAQHLSTLLVPSFHFRSSRSVGQVFMSQLSRLSLLNAALRGQKTRKKKSMSDKKAAFTPPLSSLNAFSLSRDNWLGKEEGKTKKAVNLLLPMKEGCEREAKLFRRWCKGIFFSHFSFARNIWEFTISHEILEA